MIFVKNRMNKKVIRTFLRITFFYAVFLLSNYNLSAQTYYFDYYGVKEGLAQSKVYDLVQDNQGYIWIGSESGISRFDGVNFINYTAEDGIAEGGVKALYKDRNGKIWMGHKTGAITLLDNEKMKIHPLSELINAEITSFLFDNQGNLWISTLGDGLVKLENPYDFERDTLKFEHFKGRRLSDRVFAGTIAKGDSIYFITDVGIRRYNPKDNTFDRY
ncbi:MAG: ligand-binding sensor domain-containing protein, partial [Bacteroidota bacterium]